MPQISFHLNKDSVTAEVPARLTLLEYLRARRGMMGTKEGCGEGDCGACTVAVGELLGGRVRYRAVNSCLLPAVKVHGKHVVTIEGLADGDRLHPLQQAMLDAHAVQCGFCTPGIIMALFCLFLEDPVPSSPAVSDALTGTLCRCTGYAPILRAAQSVTAAMHPRGKPAQRALTPEYFADIAALLHALADTAPQSVPEGATYVAPRNLDELFSALERAPGSDGTALLAGGTDVMVDIRMKGKEIQRLVDVSGVDELRHLAERDDLLVVGAAVTLADLLRFPAVPARLPALAECLQQMSSPQIRNVATLAGNVATASPIGDSIPVLMVYDAVVVVAARHGRRRIALREFFPAYRRTVLAPGEIIVAVEIPRFHGWSSFEKTGKRRALDIASVCSALSVKLAKARIAAVSLAYGGVAPTPVLAREAMAYLVGKPLSEEVIARAAEVAASEVTPISDVRGSAEFRRLLVRNHLIKHFLRLRAA